MCFRKSQIITEWFWRWPKTSSQPTYVRRTMWSSREKDTKNEQWRLDVLNTSSVVICFAGSSIAQVQGSDVAGSETEVYKPIVFLSSSWSTLPFHSSAFSKAERAHIYDCVLCANKRTRDVRDVFQSFRNRSHEWGNNLWKVTPEQIPEVDRDESGLFESGFSIVPVWRTRLSRRRADIWKVNAEREV